MDNVDKDDNAFIGETLYDGHLGPGSNNLFIWLECQMVNIYGRSHGYDPFIRRNNCSKTDKRLLFEYVCGTMQEDWND